MNPLPYAPLDSGKQEIRLLRIVSADDEPGPIRCVLETVSLLDKPSFCALSYVWGDASITGDILVDVDWEEAKILNFRTAKVTTNLEGALRFVRRRWVEYYKSFLPDSTQHDAPSFRLWADAICINQNDYDERASQVQIMRHIYRSAGTVLAWLGLDEMACVASQFMSFFAMDFLFKHFYQAEMDHVLDEKQDTAERALQKNVIKAYLLHTAPGAQICDAAIQKLKTLPSDYITWISNLPMRFHAQRSRVGPDSQESPDALWTGVRHVLEVPYWQRVWIVQEMLSSRHLIFATRSTVVEARVLYTAGLLLEAVGHLFANSVIIRPTPDIGPPKELCRLLAPSEDKTHLASMINVFGFRKLYSGLDTDAQVGGSKRTRGHFQLALSMCMSYSATEPRDYVYGLLCISTLDVKPNYQRSFREVYCEYIGKGLEGMKDPSSDDRVGDEEPLWFLYCSEVDILYKGHLPTWTPNLAALPHKGFRKLFMAEHEQEHIEGRADNNIFDLAGSHPSVVGESLFLSCIRPRGAKIASISGVDGESISEFLARFFKDCLSYVTEVPSLQAIYRLFFRNDSSAIDSDEVPRAIALLRILKLQGNEFAKSLDKVFTTPSFLENVTSYNIKFGAAKEIPLSTIDEATLLFDWASTFVFPGLDFRSSKLYHTMKSDPYHAFTLFRKAFVATASVIDLTVKSNRVAVTEHGYLALVPVHADIGDEVVIASGCKVPIILRPEPRGACVTYVGLAFVVGMMDGKSAKYIQGSAVEIERVEIH